jgi:hypothetical protein
VNDVCAVYDVDLRVLKSGDESDKLSLLLWIQVKIDAGSRAIAEPIPDPDHLPKAATTTSLSTPFDLLSPWELVLIHSPDRG